MQELYFALRTGLIAFVAVVLGYADSYVDDVFPVEYKDSSGNNQTAYVEGTVYGPGDGDYCSHTTIDDNELVHGHVSNYLANGFEDTATQEWVTAAKVKDYFDTVYLSGDGWSFVSAATTVGNCHSYAMKDVDLAYWLYSDLDASNRMLTDNYTPIATPENDAVACDKADWDASASIGHTWFVDDVFTNECEEVTGVKTRSEKGNSSPVYRKVYGSPLITGWQFFRKMN